MSPKQPVQASRSRDRTKRESKPHDNPIALILIYPTFLAPFCTWLMIGYFKSIPYELEERALIDRCSRIQILWRITLPLAAPGLISAGIFAFTLSWNEFIHALAFAELP